MSIPVASIRSAIYTWIKDELIDTAIGAEKIIWVDQDAPRPSRPYAAMEIIAGPVQVGHDELREGSQDGSYNVTGNRRLTVTVTLFGNESMALISRLHSSLEKPRVRDGLRSRGGLALIQQEDVQKISLKLETRIESRHQFDVIFSCVSAVEDNIGFIKDVLVTNEVSDPDSEFEVET